MSVRVESLTFNITTAVTNAAISLGPHERVVAVITPAVWTAADIGFQVSLNNTDFNHVVDPARTTAATSFARIINVEAAAGRFYVVPEALDFPLGSELKITSINIASNADVNQAAARTIQVVISKAR
jgi:hypothetical protein